MTPAKRQLWVRLLKGARSAIESEDEIYVCYALIKARGEILHSISGRTEWREVGWAMRTLTMEIHRRIQPYSTVPVWVASNHGNFYRKLRKECGQDADRTYRLAWIDDMIREFSEKAGRT